MESLSAAHKTAGIVLYAKRAGQTSFASLSAVKKALSTKKVGHTGTLDSFADGLLVVLAGRLTHLVPHITSFDKAYRALICFGCETDTLDPTGRLIASADPPSEAELCRVLPRFSGSIAQRPPMYSSVHIEGRRAHKIARNGKLPDMPERIVHIDALELESYDGRNAVISVSCSKGTYIRSLARDIALACDSRAHLRALRRTRVGPFDLTEAAGACWLSDFPYGAESPREAGGGEASANAAPGGEAAEADPFFSPEGQRLIASSLKVFDMELARRCGLSAVYIGADSIQDYAQGRPLSRAVFYDGEGQIRPPSREKEEELAVFYPDGGFAGMVRSRRGRLSYGFVVPPAGGEG